MLRWITALAVVLATPAALAAEIHCADWKRLPGAEKRTRLEERIVEAERSPEIRQFRVDRDALRRCLEVQSRDIRQALNDVCDEGLEVGIDAPERTFRDYVDSCIARSNPPEP